MSGMLRLFIFCLAIFPQAAVRAAEPAERTTTAATGSDTSGLLRFEGLLIEGVDGEVRDNLRRGLSLARLKRGTGIRAERFDYLLRQLPGQVRAATEPFGFYSPEVTIEPTRGDAVSARLLIALGEPVRVRSLDVQVTGQAQSDKTIQAAIRRFAPRVGQPFLHARYENAKAEIQRRLGARGYFLARLGEARVEVTRADHAADVRVRFDSGPRFRYGETTVSGSQLRDGLLRPLLPYAADKPFLQDKLLELQRRLADLDYFGRIDIQPRELAEDSPVPAEGEQPGIGIDVDLSPALRNVYGAGISAGTDTGVALKLAFARRWLNPAGHKFDSEMLIGQERSAAAFTYRIPAFERYTGWWTAGLKLRDEPFADTDSRVYELSVAREASWRDRLITLGWHARHERFDGVGRSLAWPELSVERKVMDDPLYPRRGYAWSVLGRWGLSGLGSDTGFRQALASVTWVHGVGRRDRLFLHGEAGYTTQADFDRLPPSLRFYAGGDRSVRGYGYQELGPLDAQAQRSGAPRLAVAGAEWEHMFGRQWGAALFVDAGNAFVDRFDPAVGVGIGLRWRSPVGPIRVDLGHGLDDPEQAFRLHIQLGPRL